MSEHHVVLRIRPYHRPLPRDRAVYPRPHARDLPLMVGLRWVMQATGRSREEILNLVMRNEIPHQIFRGAPVFEPVTIKKWQAGREILS